MAGDVVSSKYPTNNPWLALLGGTTNVVNPGYPVRSNAEWFGLSGISDGALAASGVACAVPIPVDVGQTISKISIFVGGTAEATGTHAWAALYSGLAVPALLAQSADNTGAAALAAGARFDFALQTAQLVTSTNAPNGFVYAAISVSATTMPTAMSVAVPTAVGYQLYSAGPLFFAATAGSALGGTAAATLASPSAKAVAPIVVLS